jgi:cytochrome c peroxidase
MSRTLPLVRVLLLCTVSAAAGFSTVLGLCAATGAEVGRKPATLAALKLEFRRPTTIPFPVNIAPTPARIELGHRLFSERRLSANDSISCASCHDPALAFTDGVARGKGIAREPLVRNTPTLWNLAWGYDYFWDGRAPSLEAQAQGPIEHPKEMAQSLARSAAKLALDGRYLVAFAKAFPLQRRITPATVSAALASYERTIVSPRTRFDRWVDGDPNALSAAEIDGLRLFTGKAGCSNCHSGWAFTDRAFHDIGLPGDDLGRGPIIGVPGVNHAFKTPGLRELVWTAPYMHDGSLATLDDVVRHYESGGINRPSRSTDLPKNLTLTDEQRGNLVSFLESLSSERPPRPDPNFAFGAPREARTVAASVATSQISQKDKKFKPEQVRIAASEPLKITNDDTRPHNARVFDPRMSFNSGLQEPGDTVTLRFPETGRFEVFCGIHPSMRLSVEVEPPAR